MQDEQTSDDFYLRVLRDRVTYHLPDSKPREPWALAYARRNAWLSFYEGHSKFRKALRKFYHDAYLPASHIFDDPDILIRNGYRVGSEPGLIEIEYMTETVPRGVPRGIDPDRGLQDPETGGDVEWCYYPETRKYIADLRGFCERWGLDRLYSVDTAVHAAAARNADGLAAVFTASTPNGADEVHHWCRNEARFADAMGEGAGFFAAALGVIGFVPQIGAGFDRSGSAPLHVEGFADTWHPAKESKQSARKRLLNRAKEQINLELSRIEERARTEGYITPKPLPQFARDLAWTFMRVALCKTYSEIAVIHEKLSGEKQTPHYVWKQVANRSPEVGIRTAGDPTPE